MLRVSLLAAALAAQLAVMPLTAQTVPPAFDPRLDSIARAPSVSRLEADVRRLAGFGTRSTFSDTVSATRGIGAARRWLYAEFQQISKGCGGCLEVRYTRSTVKGSGTGARATPDVDVVNVIAIQRGTVTPDRVVMMSGDIDSRNSSGSDGVKDAPGANDNASGLAGTVEAARLLTRYRFGKTIIYAGLSGEEQGLWGGQQLAKEFVDSAWTVEAVLNNDMIGNIEGINGEIDNRSFRIFSEPTPPTETEAERRARRTSGGEVDGISRQLARYVERVVRMTMPEMQPRLIYRLDRFSRGGHHRPFNDVGMPGVRIMESHEHYDRQHQDLRTENGRVYGDVLAGVNFPYVAKMTGVNAIVLASLAWAPPPPTAVRLRGAVSASTTVSWTAAAGAAPLGYKVYWRDTTAPQWTHWRWVPAGMTQVTLDNVIIDDFLFGVAAVGRDGHESTVQFPSFGR